MYPPPDQRVRRVYAWIAIHDDGSEAIITAQLPLAGNQPRYMPLVSSKPAGATAQIALARAFADASARDGRPVRIVLRSFGPASDVLMP